MSMMSNSFLGVDVVTQNKYINIINYTLIIIIIIIKIYHLIIIIIIYYKLVQYMYPFGYVQYDITKIIFYLKF